MRRRSMVLIAAAGIAAACGQTSTVNAGDAGWMKRLGGGLLFVEVR